MTRYKRSDFNCSTNRPIGDFRDSVLMPKETADRATDSFAGHAKTETDERVRTRATETASDGFTRFPLAYQLPKVGANVTGTFTEVGPTADDTVSGWGIMITNKKVTAAAGKFRYSFMVENTMTLTSAGSTVTITTTATGYNLEVAAASTGILKSDLYRGGDHERIDVDYIVNDPVITDASAGGVAKVTIAANSYYLDGLHVTATTATVNLTDSKDNYIYWDRSTQAWLCNPVTIAAAAPASSGVNVLKITTGVGVWVGTETVLIGRYGIDESKIGIRDELEIINTDIGNTKKGETGNAKFAFDGVNFWIYKKIAGSWEPKTKLW